jgi:hypothetical protein
MTPPGFEGSDRLQNLSERFIAASMFQPLVVCGNARSRQT